MTMLPDSRLKNRCSTEVDESGTTDTFTVVLDAEPTSDVVLTITSDDTGEATVPAILTFTAANWDTPQTITVTGVDDSIIDGTITSTILSPLTTPTQTTGLMAADQTVSVDTTDDDVAGFTIEETEGATEVDESGSTDTFTVVLDAEPTSDVVLTITSDDTGEATLNSPLTFTSELGYATNRHRYRRRRRVVDGTVTSTITVAVDDANSDDDFDSVADQTVSVDTLDDDVAGFTIEETDGSMKLMSLGAPTHSPLS